MTAGALAGRRRRRTGRALVVLLAAPLTLGCDGAERFVTGADESYCGQVTLGSREGLDVVLEMRLRYFGASADPPGELSTSCPPSGAPPSAACPGPGEPPLLDDAPLRRIPHLEGDALSRLTFGEGREKNLLYAVHPSGAGAAWMLAVVSFLANGEAEVRLLRDSLERREGEPPRTEQARPVFGLFRLARRPGSCF